MTSLDLYLNMCSTELWNKERTYSYVRNGIASPGLSMNRMSCNGLADLIPCIDDAEPTPVGYQLPELDPAPWYDDAVPESKNFAGLYVLDAKLSPALDRRLVQNVGHGAVLTRSRFSGRTIQVHGALIGKTCCAAEYGLRWLTQALLGSFCGACDGCNLTFLTCCPSQCPDDCLVLWETDPETEQERAVPYYRGSEQSEWQRGTDFVREMCGAGLISGPEIVKYGGRGCGCGCGTLTEVEFTIGVGNPWLYTLETVLANQLSIGHIEEGECEDCSVTFVKEDDCNFCDVPVDCDDDPDCGDPPVKPPAGMTPAVDCGCIPLHAKRTCVAVPATREWFEQALIIELNAGSEPLRNVQIHAFQNPLGYDCCDPLSAQYFDDCSACATLMVNYVPANGVLTFDSACRKVTITCNGSVRNATKNLTTVEGLPFRWFEFGCQDACIMFDVDCGEVADDATATVRSVGREL